MAANPMWVAGMKPTNPKGNRGPSVFTPKGRLLALWKGRYSVKKLNQLLDKSTVKEQLEFALVSLPYLASRQQADVITREEADELYRRLAEASEQRKKNGTAG